MVCSVAVKPPQQQTLVMDAGTGTQAARRDSPGAPWSPRKVKTQKDQKQSRGRGWGEGLAFQVAFLKSGAASGVLPCVPEPEWLCVFSSSTERGSLGLRLHLGRSCFSPESPVGLVHVAGFPSQFGGPFGRRGAVPWAQQLAVHVGMKALLPPGLWVDGGQTHGRVELGRKWGD